MAVIDLSWSEHPRYLEAAELLDPLSIISWYFSLDQIDELRNWQKRWYRYAKKTKPFPSKLNRTGMLVLTFEFNIKLLEACFLLSRYTDLAIEKNIYVPKEADLSNEKLTWPYYPKNFSKKEQLKPYRVLKKAFKQYSVICFKQYFQDWLIASLERRSIKVSDVLDYNIDVYKQFRRITDAAWIIYNRLESKILDIQSKV